jgi:predicted transposase YdaD
MAELYSEPNKASSTRRADKLGKVFRRDGGEEWILVHVEVQNRTDEKDRPLFTERMFRYFYRCYDRYQKPIAAVAILCGPDARRLSNRFKYTFMNTRLEYQYNRLCILDYTNQELEESDNPFAWVMLAAKKALLKGQYVDEKLLKGKLLIFRKLYGKGVFGDRKMRAILTFLNNYVRFAKKETNGIFNREVDKITGKKNTMDIFEAIAEMRHEEGREEGREEGLEEGLKQGRKEGREIGLSEEKENIVRRLLTNTEFSPEKIAELVDIGVSYVEELSKEVRGK